MHQEIENTRRVSFDIKSTRQGFENAKILWVFLGGLHKIDLYLGVISMHFRVFS